MRSSRSRLEAAAVAAIVVLIAVVAVRNALVYPAIAGYDAQEALDYANLLAKDGELPDATGSYYTPPGFFAVGGVGILLGEELGFEHPERVGQVVNALAAVGTVLLLLLLVRELWPGRPVLHLASLGFVVACPVVFKASAMFHPEPLSLFFSTLAITLAARMLVRRRYSLVTALGIGAALAAGQLVRAWTLWTVGVVLLVLVVALVTRSAERRAIGRALAVVAVTAFALALPWYGYQATQYDNPIFDRPQVEAPLWDRRPLGFYVSLGLPDVLTDPVRPSFSNRFAPVAYAEVWGDYFGVWHWNSSGGPPTESERRETVVQAVVGAPFTLLAVAGWLALLVFSIRRPADEPARLLVSLLPAAALVGVLYFATAYPTTDGDTGKGSFMLTAVPAWAACFGFAFDGITRRFPRLLVPLAITPRPRRSREPALRSRGRQPMSTSPSWEWRYLRGAFVAVAAIVVLQIGGWLVYRVVHEETPPLSETIRCLTREKLLELTTETDPIAASAGDGWLATRVEGNGVHVAIARSTSEAEKLMGLYQSVAGELTGRLERRGTVVYLWEGPSSPTQRQTMYDCHYD